MNRKLFAGGLFVAVCMCLLAVDGTSQAPPSPAPLPPPAVGTPPPVGSAPSPSPASPDPILVNKPPVPSGETSFETLVQELKNVRAQREALNAREKALLDKIAQK
ncbi:MAG TPA: hypothetical protein VH575_36180, partial [Gemmataceae bacterium]